VSGDKWREVTRGQPCPACGHTDWCAWTPDGGLKCERSTEAPAGMVRVKLAQGGALFRPATDLTRARRNRDDCDQRAPTVRLDFGVLQDRLAVALGPDRRDELAAALSVRSNALVAVGIGWASAADLRELRASGAGWPENPPDGAFTFPERDGGGRIVGFSLRASDGRKGCPSRAAGAHRGLMVPATLHNRPDPVLIVEGASDVAACETLGLAAVGRPSNAAGADLLAELLTDRDVIVAGENDGKPDGSWPGRDGARRVAQRLAALWEAPQLYSLPPQKSKDIRAWLETRIADGLNLNDAAACHAAGADLLAALRAAGRAVKPGRQSQAEKIVRLALERYRLGRSDTDEPFAVPRNGPNIALMFRGSRDALRAALAREYRRECNATPSASALADALTTLQGEANEAAPEPVYLRLGPYEDGFVLDLGGATGRTVLISPAGWDVRDDCPVLFRRTAAGGVLREPERGGDIRQLRELVNVTAESWPLVLGWLVSSFIPGIPHPILLLGGEQGSGKSTAARMLFGLFDPSPALLRSQPRDVEQWAIAAAGSWGVCIDNVSAISGWWSDSLCKCVTGDGWLRRKLYTDGELAVLSFRRVVGLTSIDAGALRGDLGDRLLLIDLEPIDPTGRRTEGELDALYAQRQPRILGAILDLVAAALGTLPTVRLNELPRMADFGRVLAALDLVLPGLDALPRYLAQRGRIAGDVLEADAVGAAVLTLLAGTTDEWTGTADELLKRIRPDNPGREWPRNPRALVARLKRLTPALRAAGIEVSQGRHSGGNRERFVTLWRKGAQPSVPTVPTVPLAGLLPHGGDGRSMASGVNPGRFPASRSQDRPADRPGDGSRACGPMPDGATGRDDGDDRDDHLRLLSEGCPDAEQVPPETLADAAEAWAGRGQVEP
jgi:hypothetical protein